MQSFFTSLCPGEDKPDEGLLQEAGKTFTPVLSEAERFTWAGKWGIKLGASSRFASILLWQKWIPFLSCVLLLPLTTPNLAQEEICQCPGERGRAIQGQVGWQRQLGSD